jgi:membrane fusion protein (multidrug efflux system)
MHLRPLCAAALLACTSLLAACGNDSNAAAPVDLPPPTVGVIRLEAQPTIVASELPGRVEATRLAEVRARVPGIVLERVFREGSDVKAGQALFRIDPAPLKAEVESASARLRRAEAALRQATVQAERYAPLVAAHAVSRQEYDDALAAQQLAQADVAASRAALSRARLDLGYATVEAPIAGRVGRALVTEGALVGQGEATPMATIQQIDPVYVDFTQPVSELARLRKRFGQGDAQRADAASAVTLLLDDGAEYAHRGRLLFSDVTVDPGTGQVMLRASFPNEERLLLPGMFVRVRLAQGIDEQALRVPQQAVQRGADGRAAVWVVDAQNQAARRTVKTGASVGDDWIVTEGLAAGDSVIVDGVQKIQPGAPVQPTPWRPARDATSTPASS